MYLRNVNWYTVTKTSTSIFNVINPVRPTSVLVYTVTINYTFTRSLKCSPGTQSSKAVASILFWYRSNMKSISQSIVRAEIKDQKIDLARNSDKFNSHKGHFQASFLQLLSSTINLTSFQHTPALAKQQVVKSPVLSGLCGVRDDAGEDILV